MSLISRCTGATAAAACLTCLLVAGESRTTPFFGMLHAPLGSAQIDATGDTLLVTSIGAGGADGIAMSFPDGPSADPLVVSMNVAHLDFNFDVRCAPIDGTGSSISMIGPTPQVGVSSSFPASAGANLTLLLDGAAVDQFMNVPAGDLGEFASATHPGVVAEIADMAYEPDADRYTIAFDPPINFIPSAVAETIQCDQLVIEPHVLINAPITYDGLALTGSHMQLEITAIAFSTEPCLSDTDDSGAVDVDDLINVILDWGTDGSANGGDVNASGTVDVDDLVAVIVAWGPCE